MASDAVHRIPIVNKTNGMLYTPHNAQIRFHRSKKRFKAFVGGVGSGKTLALVNEMFKLASIWPGTHWVITAPTFPMLRDATMVAWREWIPDVAVKAEVRGEKKLVLWNNSELWFRSSNDPESLRGPNLNGFGMDEGAKDKKKTWDIMIGRMRRVTKHPVTGKRCPNVAMTTTTPKGFNWVYQVFVKNADPEIHEVIYCSSLDNPHLPEDFLDSLKRSYSGAFYDQEVLGRFVAHEGVVYREFNRQTHEVSIDNYKDRYKNNPRFIGSIDWGYANPMVGLLAVVDADENLHLASEIYQSRLKIEDFAKLLREQEEEVAKRLGLEMPIDVTYYADPSDVGLGVGSMMRILREKGFNIQKADNSIINGINAVAARLPEDSGGDRPRLLVDPVCVHTLSEFEQYSYPEHDDDTKPLNDKPLKVNDHAMDALRYMIMSLDKGATIRSFTGGEGVIF